MVKAQDRARDEHRAAIKDRHLRLKAMVAHWRKAVQLVGQIEGKVTRLLQRTQIIDRHIGEYEEIIKQTDRAERMLSSSSLVQFFVSLFVLVIAVGGAVINFHLIARPMAEMVGGTNFIGSWRVADIAALVIILVEVSMGLFLMESLRITRLFPVIGALPDKWRVIMIWITLGLLTALASVEAGLAYMREVLLQDELATSALLRGDAEAVLGNEFLWITTAAQMGMGFILPFALTFVAIPLETFVHSLRTVLGVTGVGLLRGLAAALRLLGAGTRYLGRFAVDVYDVVIFLPLWLEAQVKAPANGVRPPASQPERWPQQLQSAGQRPQPEGVALMRRLLLIAGLGAALAGCSGEAAPTTRGVYLLMDTSGTYTEELNNAQTIINAILAKLEPGDSFAVARVDTGSFSEKDIVARVTFDERPSMTNQQKRKFRDQIDAFVRTVKPAAYTDITGGVLQAVEYLNEKNPGRKTILVFSDLQEDLQDGYIRDIPLTMDGFEVVALNVTKLRSDNVDPREYINRLESWQSRVESGGGTWRVINDLDRLDRILG